MLLTIGAQNPKILPIIILYSHLYFNNKGYLGYSNLTKKTKNIVYSCCCLNEKTLSLNQFGFGWEIPFTRILQIEKGPLFFIERVFR